MRERHQTQSYSLLITAIPNSAARLKGLEEDLHLTGQQFNTLISIMYVGYTLTQIPSYVSPLVSEWHLFKCHQKRIPPPTQKAVCIPFLLHPSLGDHFHQYWFVVKPA